MKTIAFPAVKPERVYETIAEVFPVTDPKAHTAKGHRNFTVNAILPIAYHVVWATAYIDEVSCRSRRMGNLTRALGSRTAHVEFYLSLVDTRDQARKLLMDHNNRADGWYATNLSNLHTDRLWHITNDPQELRLLLLRCRIHIHPDSTVTLQSQPHYSLSHRKEQSHAS